VKFSLESTWLIWQVALGALQTPNTRAAATLAAPSAPEVLPGKGLAQHDFFYAGEAKEERMFIVRNGEVVWTYTHNGRGEISDALWLPNGNVLFAHQFEHRIDRAARTNCPVNRNLSTIQFLLRTL
jgi:hypothetical protein